MIKPALMKPAMMKSAFAKPALMKPALMRHFVLMIFGLVAISACGSGANGGANAAPAAQPAPAAPAKSAQTAPAAAAAAPAHDWQLGADYMLIDPRVPTSTGDKVEVVEVFSYACPHCAHYQPYIDQLKAKLPANAQFVALPAVFNPSWEPFARAFYAAKSMGVLDQTHQALFDAIHRDHLPLNDMQALANFYGNHGVAAASFLSTANSFVIEGQLAHGTQLVQQYGVSATPTLIVNGKYRVEMSAEKHIGPEESIDIALMLVKQEAQAKSAAAKPGS